MLGPRARPPCACSPLCRRPSRDDGFIRLNGEADRAPRRDVRGFATGKARLCRLTRNVITSCAGAIVLCSSSVRMRWGSALHRYCGAKLARAVPLAVELASRSCARGVRVFSSGFLPEKTSCTLRRAAWQFVRPRLSSSPTPCYHPVTCQENLCADHGFTRAAPEPADSHRARSISRLPPASCTSKPHSDLGLRTPRVTLLVLHAPKAVTRRLRSYSPAFRHNGSNSPALTSSDMARSEGSGPDAISLRSQSLFRPGCSS